MHTPRLPGRCCKKPVCFHGGRTPAHIHASCTALCGPSPMMAQLSNRKQGPSGHWALRRCQNWSGGERGEGRRPPWNRPLGGGWGFISFSCNGCAWIAPGTSIRVFPSGPKPSWLLSHPILLTQRLWLKPFVRGVFQKEQSPRCQAGQWSACRHSGKTRNNQE